MSARGGKECQGKGHMWTWGEGSSKGGRPTFGKKSKYRIVSWRKDFIGRKVIDGGKIFRGSLLAKTSKKRSSKN